MSTCPKCGADETAAYMLGLEKSKDRIAELEQRNAELLAALKAIADHQVLVTNNMASMSTTWSIATTAITAAEGE